MTGDKKVGDWIMLLIGRAIFIYWTDFFFYDLEKIEGNFNANGIFFYFGRNWDVNLDSV